MNELAYLYRKLNELNADFEEADWFTAEEIQKEIDLVQIELRERQQAVLEDPFQAFAYSGFATPLQIDICALETKGNS